MQVMKVLTVADEKEEKFLRTAAKPFDFNAYSKQDLAEILKEMRSLMKSHEGVGLAAVQVGIPYRFFIAQMPATEGGGKFYAIFNPEIERVSGEEESETEGCLSIPRTFGEVKRDLRIVLTGQDKNGKKIKIKAFGYLARIFQHETDHLNGILFIDKAKKVYTVTEEERTNKSEKSY